MLQHNHPGAIGLLSQLDIPISLMFLCRFPSEAKAAGLSPLRMAHWLKANGYCGRQTVADLIDHLHEAANGRVTGPAAEASELIVTTLVDLLTELRHQQEQLETRIEEALLPHPDASLAAAAGVAPSTRQSSKYLNVAYRRGCNKNLRAALVDWAQDTPRSKDPGPRLDQDPVALLARPRALQPIPARRAQHPHSRGCLT